MKLFDLRLRGSDFTLGTVVNETDHYNFRRLIGYLQDTTIDPNAEVPAMFELFPNNYLSSDTCEKISKWLLDESYATRKGTQYTFTSKAFEVFEKTIAKDNELAKSGFSYCPCAMP